MLKCSAVAQRMLNRQRSLACTILVLVGHAASARRKCPIARAPRAKPASRAFRDIDNDAKTPEVGLLTHHSTPTNKLPRVTVKNVLSGDLLPLAGISIPKSVMKMIKIYSVS